VISSAVNSNVSFLENSQVETTGRIAAVLAARAKQYLPGIKVDRGADTPDKSWLNIARRNYKFYGFDIKMLDEMYMIAAENGW
jgi:fructose-bisphosphate aldolase class 1